MKDMILSTMDDIERAAKAMAASHFFQDAASAAQAVTKILAGREMGFGPFASMTGIYIINGRPAVGAHLMAAAIKRSGRYDYRVIELTDTRCEIAFYENGKEIGRSVFTIEDARKAGTKNLEKYPKNMLFARAISNGVRFFCPDVFTTGVYTPEELGAEVDDEGAVIDVTPAPEPADDAGDGGAQDEYPAARLFDFDGMDEAMAESVRFALAAKTPKGVVLGDVDISEWRKIRAWFGENPARKAANPNLINAVEVLLAALPDDNS